MAARRGHEEKSARRSCGQKPGGCGVSEPFLANDSRPRLPRGVRLKHDEVRGEWLLLAPERVVKANPIAVAVLQRCDGIATFDEIVDALSAEYSAERARVATDVRALLTELATKRMVDL
ncbi:MAG: pyrroloquinoline quinone biosynthesis peptide chaperone PqqD [Hyphomicrobiales bacterium]|nr:pyrroloquinoline quinone biosynthesis peptide chaperone PqqD [Hyphomicrobiales bacterium]